MDPIEDQRQRLVRQRVLVWALTTGALACSIAIFLATNSPSPEPVAEPAPPTDWQIPTVTSWTPATSTPNTTLEALAAPPAATTTTQPPPPDVVHTTTPPPPPPTTTVPPPNTKQLRSVGSGRCLDVPNGTTAPGTQLQIYTCNGLANQAWSHTSSDQLTVTLDGTTMCMDAYGQGTSPGTQVITWPCNGQANEEWTLNSDGTITGVQSGLCLDVTGGSNGALAQLWTCHGGGNQQWRLR